MKIALIHNPDAFRGEADGTAVRQVFERAGHDVAYVSTRETNWQNVISPEIARVIIVGGDGTVQSVAPHLRGIPFAILPFGTANNIAHCLRQTSNAEVLASRLEQAEMRHLDLGKVTYGRQSKTFLEAIGMGIFAESILAIQDWPRKEEMEQAESRKEKFIQALEQLHAICRRYEEMAVELRVDDDSVCDHFIMIAAMNMNLIGPRLHLAPKADPGDGYLDLVLVRNRHRNELCRWLENQLPGQKEAAPLESRRCRRVEVSANNIAPVHIDGHVLQRPEFPLTIELEATALEYAVVQE